MFRNIGSFCTCLNLQISERYWIGSQHGFDIAIVGGIEFQTKVLARMREGFAANTCCKRRHYATLFESLTVIASNNMSGLDKSILSSADP